MAEFNLSRTKGGQREEMIIFDKDGSLKLPTNTQPYIGKPVNTPLGNSHIS